jgi:hypothetical protein
MPSHESILNCIVPLIVFILGCWIISANSASTESVGNPMESLPCDHSDLGPSLQHCQKTQQTPPCPDNRQNPEAAKAESLR